MGLTMSVSLLSDGFSLLTGHIYICYLISTTIYRWQLTTLASLWNLFRGKRYNVLRKRMDSWEYDLDQLLFGTILFTLVSFLFPTVVAYHALFALMRFMTVLVYASMETVVAFMNHFPLFAIMLRLKDPSRLPGGIHFKIHNSSSTSSAKFMTVCNQPITFGSIFFQYLRLWSRLSAHYSPLRLLKMVVTGAYVGVIPRYSMQYHRFSSSSRDVNKVD
jgi:phosphatidylinositol glycan class Q protein